MNRLPPRSTQTDTLFPYTTLFRSGGLNSLPASFRIYCLRSAQADALKLPYRRAAVRLPSGRQYLHISPLIRFDIIHLNLVDCRRISDFEFMPSFSIRRPAHQCRTTTLEIGRAHV